jgi:thymidylate synthase
MKQYKELVETVMKKGRLRKTSVQGPGTKVRLVHEMRFDLSEGFPLVTIKSLKGSWRAVVGELLWFLSGSTNIEDLHKMKVHLWDSWATSEICKQYGLPPGELGRIYGAQWRNWRKAENETVDRIQEIVREPPDRIQIESIRQLLKGRPKGGETIDQVARLIKEIKAYPDSKRMMVNSWNAEDVDNVFVAPCHATPFKTMVAEGIIDLVNVQRSADVLIGVPFNIASYALLLMMIAQVTDLTPGELICVTLDSHIYEDQFSFVQEILSREPKSLPTVKLNPEVKDIFKFSFEDVSLENYNPHPPIKGIPVGI